jgi:glycosyltransferase involved in cell wall biosynthesis
VCPPMEFSELVDTYELPAHDRLQAYPVVQPLRRSSWARARLARLRRGDRRLAYLDNTFPWARSGFRYHEALAIRELLPDTLFFSMWRMRDSFPAAVHPISAFPEIAAREGITDAYGVFQLFLEGIAGTLRRYPDEVAHPFAGPDLSGTMTRLGIRLHGSVYPGGGFVPTAENYERLDSLAGHVETLMSYVPELLENVPRAVAIDQAFTEVGFYNPTRARWRSPVPLTCLFAADSPPRKGLDVALEAFRNLDPDRFHLHVVGPHVHRRAELPPELATFHGWLTPEALRALHRDVHVFLSPVSTEAAGPPGSYQGVTDGFPTQAAADAMSSGCLLMSSNPAADRRVLQPDTHYLELPAVPDRWRATLHELAVGAIPAQEIAEAGSARVRERMDIRRATARKLQIMGLRH